MHEILSRLGPGQRVLDLGSRSGSFTAAGTAALTVRLDIEPAPGAGSGGEFVAGDASGLPFASGAFDAVIANHSLEHFVRLEPALKEIGRVLKPGGTLFVAVPDASTFTDRLYRWLARGGGHVNPFISAAGLASRISAATGAPHYATRTLPTSFSFLNRRNMAGPAPLRVRWFVALGEPALAGLTGLLRRADRMAGTRLSVYGWALYFGPAQNVEVECWTNACVRCGSGHPARQLEGSGLVRRWLGIVPVYECPGCGAVNLYSREAGRGEL